MYPHYLGKRDFLYRIAKQSFWFNKSPNYLKSVIFKSNLIGNIIKRRFAAEILEKSFVGKTLLDLEITVEITM